MPFATHLAVQEPESDDLVIWRYMDFTKLVSLLQYRALFFPSLAVLSAEDPLEGSLSQASLAELHQRPLRAGVDAEDATANFQQHLRIYAELQRTLYASCWHHDDFESAAMWRLYLKSGEGVAIRSTVGRLKESFADIPEKVHIGRVRYIDFATEQVPLESGFEPAMHKRRSFEHEREIRVVLYKPEVRTDVMKVMVPLRILVEAVYVAPNAPYWLYDLVGDVLKRYGLDLPVELSGLSQGPLY